ncbi:MAG: chorismate mutase [Clostridia bacterium]|nr:chorismate mutase [Clostridia bacterium]
MEDIKALRKKIDEIDAQLVKAFTDRIAVCEEIGKIKKEKGMPIVDEAREAEIIEAFKGKLSERDFGYVKSLYKRIFTLCEACQK